MDTSVIITLGHKTALMVLYLTMPVLLAAFVVGLIISILQAATQIQEMTLAFIPKILAVIAVLFFFGPWMLNLIISFTKEIFNLIPQIFH